MSEHAPISPSALACHLKCFGRYQLCKDLPPSSTSEYAHVGTIKHDMSASILKGEIPSIDSYKKNRKSSVFEYQLTDDDLQEVQVYLDEIEKIERLCSKHAIFQIEQKKKMDWLSPLCYGTADFVAIEPMEFIYVVDAKFGQKAVKAYKNPQLLAYAMAAVGENNEHRIENIITKIVQPKTGDDINEYECMVEELYGWGLNTLQFKIKQMDSPNPPLTSGPHCDLWCPGKEQNICPEFQKQELVVANQMFAKQPNVPVAPKHLNGVELQKALDIATMAEIWLKAVKKEGHDRALTNNPEKAPDYKLVKGRLGNRTFKDAAIVEEILSPVLAVGQLYEKKLRGVPAIEKMLRHIGAEEVLDSVLLPRKEGKLKLVHRNAKGKEVIPVTEMFKEV